MKRLTKKILPYLISSLLVIGLWKLLTWSDNYAWFPKGKELLMLDIALTSIFFYKTLFWLVTVNLTVFGLLKLRQKKFKTTGIIFGLTLTYHFAVGQVIDKKCAFHYYSVFHNHSVTEEYITDPIKQAGYQIGPILTEQIHNKEMMYRRYAISGLQEINYTPSTELMQKIMFDKTEIEVLRADAYKTLKLFNTKESNKLIAKFTSEAIDSVDLKVIKLGEYFYERK